NKKIINITILGINIKL
ncbi:hypothetical protein, partial [Plasmodium yoelii yoelii]